MVDETTQSEAISKREILERLVALETRWDMMLAENKLTTSHFTRISAVILLSNLVVIGLIVLQLVHE